MSVPGFGIISHDRWLDTETPLTLRKVSARPTAATNELVGVPITRIAGCRGIVLCLDCVVYQLARLPNFSAGIIKSKVT
jgi:hypothetical protein